MSQRDRKYVDSAMTTKPQVECLKSHTSKDTKTKINQSINIRISE